MRAFFQLTSISARAHVHLTYKKTERFIYFARDIIFNVNFSYDKEMYLVCFENRLYYILNVLYLKIC